MGTPDHRANVRKNIARFREESKMSQEELARAAGLSVKSVWRYESGQGYPDTDSLVALGKALGRSLDDFMAEEPPPPDPQRLPVVRFRLLQEMTPELEQELLQREREINVEFRDRLFGAKQRLRRKKR